MTFTKGSTSNGYVACYADNYRVYNAPKGRIEGDFVFGKPDGVKTLVGYLGSAATATLPTDYDGENDVIGSNAFRARTSVTSIAIPSSVTSIGFGAFYGCTGLTSVEIPNSVTTIGDNAFRGCTGLKSITIPNSVTTIGDNAFYDCYGLTSVTIPNSVTTIGESAFYNCSSLKSITIPNSVTSIESSAFYGCSSLKSITIPNSVTSIGYQAFYNCYGLTSITIPNSVTTIGDNAFYGCSSLASVTIPNGVTTIGDYAFYNCNNLKIVVNLSDLTFSYRSTSYGYVAYYANNLYNSSNCIVIGDYVFNNSNGVNKLVAYLGDSNLKELTLPANCNGENYEIGDYLLYGCKNLCSVTIGSGALSVGNNIFSITPTKVIFLGNTPPSGVSKIKGTVNYVSSAANYGFGTEYTNLSSIFEVDGVKYVLVSTKDRICDVIDCNYNTPVEDILIDSLVTYRNIKLTVRNVNQYAFYNNDYVKNATIKNNGNIGQYAFAYSNGMQTATLGNRVEGIANYAFAGCNSLEEIIIPDNVLSVGSYCFANCTSLERAIMGSGVKTLNEYTFSGCSALNYVKIGENVETVNIYVFNNCSSLPQINIPQATRKVNNYAFKGCGKLATVVIEDKVFALNLGSNGSSPLFADCKLDSVYIGGKLEYNKTSSYGYSPFYGNKYLRSVTYNDMEVAIYDKEFMNCNNLRNIVFGKGISSIGVSAFKNCTSLASITIPDWVTYMGNSCFAGCTAMKSAKVGAGVETLEWYSFGNCSKLTDMQIGVNVDSIGKSVFYNCNSLPQINIPQATKVINDSVFYNCSSLADVVIEDRTSVLKLGSNGYSSSSSATSSTNPLFNSCPLDSVYIGGKINYKTEKEYGFSPFFRNTSLRTIVVADSETLVYDNEFYGCTGLTDVVIGDGVTSIGKWAFSGCTSLVNFSFGSKVETIGKEAFSDCTSMRKIVSNCDVPPVCGDQALADINVWDCTLYVNYNSIDAYYNAEQWNDFFFIESKANTVTFMIDDEIYSKYNIVFGEKITLPEDPVKEGHTFTGWGEVPAVMPNENLTFYAEFSVNNYTVTYIVDGEEYEVATLPYGSLITPPTAPEKYGYTFNCWENLPETVPAENIEVVAIYDEVPVENIPGDITGDGEVNVADVTSIVAMILDASLMNNVADITGDGEVNVADVTSLVSIILGTSDSAPTRAAATRSADAPVVSASFDEDNNMFINVSNPDYPFTAAQFDIEFEGGISVVTDGEYYDVFLGSRTTSRKHSQPECAVQPDGSLRVVILSLSNALFTGTDGDVATISLDATGVADGSYSYSIKNIVLSDPNSVMKYPADVEAWVNVAGGVTGINSISADGENANEAIYDLSGRKVKNPVKGGVYIKGGKKFIM